MRQHRLGDRTITSVGCGDVRLATATARNVDAQSLERAVHSALELGITLIELADEEAAEQLCGAAVRALRLRDHVTLACRIPDLPARPGAPRRDVLPERLPPAYLQQRIEASLRTTRLDALPLVQLSLRAAWRTSSAWPELAGTCARLVREGKVLAWGAFLSGDAAEGSDGPSDAELVTEPWLATLSIPHSLCERGAASVRTPATSPPPDPSSADNPIASLLDPALAGPEALLMDPAAAALLLDPSFLSKVPLLGSAGSASPLAPSPGAAPQLAPSPGAAPQLGASSPGKLIFARRPLAGGALAGTLGPGVRLALHDDRRSLDDATLERIAVLAARLAPLVEHEPPAARSCEAARAALERGRRPPHVEARTLAELALRFVIDRGAIALPRLHRAEKIPEAISSAAAPPLSPELVEQLGAMLDAP